MESTALLLLPAPSPTASDIPSDSPDEFAPADSPLPINREPSALLSTRTRRPSHGHRYEVRLLRDLNQYECYPSNVYVKGDFAQAVWRAGATDEAGNQAEGLWVLLLPIRNGNYVKVPMRGSEAEIARRGRA